MHIEGGGTGSENWVPDRQKDGHFTFLVLESQIRSTYRGGAHLKRVKVTCRCFLQHSFGSQLFE